MRYLEPSFSTFAVGSDEYRANHERIFGKKREDVEPTVEVCVVCTDHEEELGAGSGDQPSPPVPRGGASRADNLASYLDEIGDEAEHLASQCYGDGPGKMVDCVRFETYSEVAKTIDKIRNCLETGQRLKLLP